MKYLIVLMLVLAVAWQWRNARRGQLTARKAHQSQSRVAQDMVACAHCGVHLPSQDAVQGKAGQYCDDRHRAAAEH